jgi:hypothetical protein
MLGLGLQFNESTVLEWETKLISREKKVSLFICYSRSQVMIDSKLCFCVIFSFNGCPNILMNNSHYYYWSYFFKTHFSKKKISTKFSVFGY